MPEDDRAKRRLGDATKARIDDLAAGWSLDGDEPPALPDATPTQAPRTQPPRPPPGPRAKAPSSPPPSPAPRPISVIPDELVELATPTPTPLPLPAPTPLPLPPRPVVAVSPPRADASAASTSPFERGDPTVAGDDTARGDATVIDRGGDPGHAPTVGTLRSLAALRRKRGIAGDVRYVFTALVELRDARKELARLSEQQRTREASRKRHLTTLGRSAIAADGLDHPALGKAREALGAVEDERGKHAGAVAASDAELERVRRERAAQTKRHTDAIAAAGAEIAELGTKLEPLDKQAAAARKQAAQLAEQLRKIARKIADTEALLTSPKSEPQDRAAVQADLATLKADQKAVQRDEPALASVIDALEPRIAALRAQLGEAEQRKTDLVAAEAEDLGRTTELYEAIGAKRKVVERAVADTEAARDKVLFELGDRLYVDRPASLSAELAPIDGIDLELGEGDRRRMELREILSNVDRAKLLRGTSMIVIALAVVAVVAVWLLA